MNITLQQVVDEMRKNGYPWVKGAFQNFEGASCALGQVIRNLGYTRNREDADDFFGTVGWEINDKISAIAKKNLREKSYTGIIDFNDHGANTLSDVVEFTGELIKGYENEVIVVPDNDSR